MAVTGRKPKEDRTQIRHRNPAAPGTEWIEVDDVPFAGAPELPPRDIDGVDPLTAGLIPVATWPHSTQRWYRTISAMPHAKLWTPADWEFVFSVAETHARFAEAWKGCATGAELRAKEKMLGLTHDQRRDLRIRYVQPATTNDNDLPADVVRLDDFRGL